MKISCHCSYLAVRYGYRKAFRLIKSAGFDAADVSLVDMVHPDSPFNQPGYQEYALQIRKWADEAGLIINQTHAPFVYPLDQWELGDELMPILKRSLEISGIFGADTEIIHPYHHPEYLGHEDEMFRKNMEYYGELLPAAREYNVRIAVENMFQTDPVRGYICHDTCSQLYDFLRYIDTLNDEYAVACLDIGHIALIYQNDQPWDFIYGLGHDRLKSLHIHDNNRISDQHLLPYQGDINWQKVTQALGEIDYDGYFTYETDGNLKNCDDEFLPVHLKYMADLARHLCDLIDRNRPATN